MTTYRIYETGNDTGKKWFYAKQKFGWFWTTPSLEDLQEPFYGLNPEPKRFNSKDELLNTIEEAHEKKSRCEKSINSIYHKVVDELEIAD